MLCSLGTSIMYSRCRHWVTCSRLLSQLCWWCTWLFLLWRDVCDFSFCLCLSVNDVDSRFYFGGWVLADQGSLGTAQVFGNRCFLSLQAEFMKQLSCCASRCGRGGAKPRPGGDFLAFVVLLVFICWLFESIKKGIKITIYFWQLRLLFMCMNQKLHS